MASVHDSRNDAIFGKQLTVYSQPPTMTTPTPPLSPAAQVLDAFLKDADEDATLRLFQGHLADALRAAADQPYEVPCQYRLDDYWTYRCGVEAERDRLRAIAAELRQEVQP
jgi:hypothetical protein